MLRDAWRRVGWIVGTAGVIATCVPMAASAHPNYELLERAMMDDRGRELRLILSYTDGIMLSDPVKLVIRDSDGRAIAETDWARTISVICARPAACLVFAYETFSPIPSHIWWLNNGQLEATRSTSLAILGIVAPLWSDAWGYVVAVGFLLLPWPVLAMLWKAGSAVPQSDASGGALATTVRDMAIAGGFFGSAGYYLICAYVVAMLAELSPLLTIGSALVVWGWIAFALRAGRATPGLMQE